MGIHCRIKVYKTAGNVLRPGSLVSGILKYTIDEETICNKITVSFKGNGYLLVKHRRRDSNMYSYRKSESYTDIDYIIYRDEAGAKLPAGSYTTEFNFILPENIPPSLEYTKKTSNYLVHCCINYYIRIKFERSGLTKGATRFKQFVPVISVARPQLPTQPTIYGEQRTIKHFLPRSTSVLKITATIINSVIMPGDRIRIEYKVNNDTHINVRGVISKLLEEYTFKSKGGKEVKFSEHLESTIKTSGIIKMREVKKRVVEIPVPFKLGSLDYSNLVARKYFVLIILELSMKHEDVVLKIPVQIGDEVCGMDVRPPSYWDVLLEDGIEDQFEDRLTLNDNDAESETEI